MRLSTFIETNLNEILQEWDRFAETLFPDVDKSKTFLFRDHAREVLLELTADMETKQSKQQQADKSKGVVSPFHPDDSAANVHGMMRHVDGFDVVKVAAEFRALRASVLQLWLPKISAMSKEVVVDIIRFNEAIDEALADSIETFKS